MDVNAEFAKLQAMIHAEIAKLQGTIDGQVERFITRIDVQIAHWLKPLVLMIEDAKRTIRILQLIILALVVMQVTSLAMLFYLVAKISPT
jgi:hypothetical protein